MDEWIIWLLITLVSYFTIEYFLYKKYTPQKTPQPQESRAVEPEPDAGLEFEPGSGADLVTDPETGFKSEFRPELVSEPRPISESELEAGIIPELEMAEASRAEDSSLEEEKPPLTFWGPIIMMRTQRGQKLLDRMARRERLWRAYGSLALGVCAVSMVLMFYLLAWVTTKATEIPASAAPTPDQILIIPGINPFVPLWYGLLSLSVALIIHELSHGVMTRVGKLKVKAMGMIFCVFPIGAFVEPDEGELNNAPKRVRMKVYAVGPTANILFAILCALMFSVVFMGSAVTVNDAYLLNGVMEDSELDRAELHDIWIQVIELNGEPFDPTTLLYMEGLPAANQTVTLRTFYEGEYQDLQLTSGVMLSMVWENSPADLAGMKQGMLLGSINGFEIRNGSGIATALNGTSPGDNVTVTVFEYRPEQEMYFPSNLTVELADYYQYYSTNHPELISSDDDHLRNRSFIGISSSYLGFSDFGHPDNFLERLQSPLLNSKDFDGAMRNLAIYIALPILKLSPMESPVSDLYEFQGPLAALPQEASWLTANVLYWLFWLNLMVGLTNVLPAVPLDGGFLFRDGFDHLLCKLRPKMNEKKREELTGHMTGIFALLVLFMIVWQFIGPRL